MKYILNSLLISFCLLLPAGEITLAENGTAKAAIVIPRNAAPIVRFAAKELAVHLQKITGAEFTIGITPRSDLNLYLGFGKAEDFRPDQYVIRAKGNRIDIYGKDTSAEVNLFNYFYDNPDKGTLRGVYNFLDSLGVRWLAPGNDGIYIPKRETLRIPEMEIQFIPYFQDRQITDAWNFKKIYPDATAYIKNTNELYLWGIRNNVSTRNMVPGCHSERSLKLFNNQEWQAHPTAHQLMKDGKRNPHYSCWTDPYTREIWLRAADGYFSGKTPVECGFNLKGYLHSLWPMPFISPNEFMIDPMDHYSGNDGRCRCARCQEFREKNPGTDDTEILWGVIGGIAKEIGKKYPERYISTLVYPPKSFVPRKLGKVKNLRVRICLPGARLMLYPDQLEKDLKRIQDWSNLLGAKNIPLWTYQCSASFGKYLPGIPDTYPHLTAKFINKVKPFCAGMYCENHNITHTQRNLDLYIFMRMMWNPERDAEQELNEYFRLYYGPAAVPAKELFTRLENNWFKVEQLIFADPKKHSSLGVRNKDKDGAQKLVWSRVYTSAEMKKIDGLIQSMIHLAPSGSIYARRVGLLQKYMINVMKRERSDVMGKEEKRQALKLSALFIGAKDCPSEQEWNSAPEYKLVSAQKMKPNLQAPGAFRLLASQDKLYIRAILKEPQMSASNTDINHRNGNTEIWKDNCIELFFYTERSKKFWHIIINDNNAWSSQTKGRVLNRWEQLKGMRVKTSRSADAWTAEISIPLATLKTDKTDLRFNFTRERNVNGSKTEYSTWSPLAITTGWQNVDNYGNISFMRDKE